LIEGKPYLAQEYAAGVMYWIDLFGQQRGPEARVDAQMEYSGKILHLIANADEDVQDQLINYYPVGDPEEFRYQNNRYNNLKNLIIKPGVPDKFKQAAFAQWKEIIVSQNASAEMVDGIDYQDAAIEQMAEFLDENPRSKDLPPELKQQITAFLEENWPSERNYISDDMMRILYKLIDDEDLRFKVAYRNIAPPPEDEHHIAFQVITPEDVGMVEWVRAEARKRGIVSFEERAEAIYQQQEDLQRKSQARQERELEFRRHFRTVQ
jgi:hypothetical protein